MSQPPRVTFAGYVSETGRRVVQTWFDGLSIDERDEIRDTLSYLVALPVTAWRRPEVDKVSAPLVEIRCKANRARRTIRMYDAFDEQLRGRFILLHGNEAKKRSRDKTAQDLALARLAAFQANRRSFDCAALRMTGICSEFRLSKLMV